MLIILIAPNVSEQMGGEAMKALQIFREFRKIRPSTIQITHERNRHELDQRLGMDQVVYVKDTALSIFIWRSVVFRWLLDYWFSCVAVRLAERMAKDRGLTGMQVVLHQTEPNSPVLPRALSKVHPNVFGPINGNIYYPPIFRSNERIAPKLRRIFHNSFQRVNRAVFRSIADANLILVAGGKRTLDSLRLAGCPESRLWETLDCGIPDRILDRPRVTHVGRNGRFVHFGRLVFHKGTHLIIQSLAKTRHEVRLDIVGTGPELQHCKQLAAELGLEDRIRFLGWYTSHDELLTSFSAYRGVVLPSIEDANGIVIQEAMAMGLPPVCLNWGGPQLLVEDGINGYLVDPVSQDHITSQMADRLDRLTEDGDLAEAFSKAGREKAEDWRWSYVARQWVDGYDRLRADRLDGADASRSVIR